MIAFFEKKRYDIFFYPILFFFLCFFSGSVSRAEKINALRQRIQQTRQSLETIEKRILKLEKELKKIQTEEKKVFQRIEICDQFIEKYRYEKKVFDDKIVMNQVKQENLYKEINQIQNSLVNQHNSLALRLRSWYKAGPLKFWRILFESDSFIELSQKITYLRLMAQEDSKLIQTLTSQIKEKRTKQREICLYQKEIEELRKKIVEREEEWVKKKQEKERYLGLLHEEGKKYRLTTRKLYDQRAELQKLLTSLQKNPQQSSSFNFAAQKGRLSWPIQNTVGSSSREYKVISRNKGVTIHASKGKEIYSIYDGKVLYADWCTGYGKLLIVDHGGGYCSIYAHVSEFLIDFQDMVKKGQLIALVGDTGAVREPQLYFEIRFQAVPLEPLAWLK